MLIYKPVLLMQVLLQQVDLQATVCWQCKTPACNQNKAGSDITALCAVCLDNIDGTWETFLRVSFLCSAMRDQDQGPLSCPACMKVGRPQQSLPTYILLVRLTCSEP